MNYRNRGLTNGVARLIRSLNLISAQLEFPWFISLLDGLVIPAAVKETPSPFMGVHTRPGLIPIRPAHLLATAPLATCTCVSHSARQIFERFVETRGANDLLVLRKLQL